MSLGGSYSSTLNNAVTELYNAGIVTSVAAGNDGVNASNTSPASAARVCTPQSPYSAILMNLRLLLLALLTAQTPALASLTTAAFSTSLLLASMFCLHGLAPLLLQTPSVGL